MIRLLAFIGTSLTLLIVIGCDGGANLHEVHEGPLLNDKVLEQRVEAALRRAGPDYQNVHVNADNGRVTLTRTVVSADARTKAEKISGSVYDVKTTDNEVRVNTPAPAP